MKIFGTVGENDFVWWKIIGWSHLIIGNVAIILLGLSIISLPVHNIPVDNILEYNDVIKRRLIFIIPLVLFLIILNSWVGYKILKFNKLFFLIDIILLLIFPCIITLSLGFYYEGINYLPLIVINGIYLYNRWCHPKVNKGKPCGKYLENEILEKFKEKVSQ